MHFLRTKTLVPGSHRMHSWSSRDQDQVASWSQFWHVDGFTATRFHERQISHLRYYLRVTISVTPGFFQRPRSVQSEFLVADHISAIHAMS